MAIETERKYLLKNDNWKQNSTPVLIRQGYLFTSENSAMRVRIQGEKAFINIKSSKNGLTRLEYEYAVPTDDANEILDKLCHQPLIVKNRYIVNYCGKKWEIDEFLDENEGLVVAEIELKAENEEFEKPEWIGEEVTFEKRYYNSQLTAHPYKKW